MLTDAERIKLYGSAEAVAEADRRIAEAVDYWPPLTARQKARLRGLLSPGVAEPPTVLRTRNAQINAKAA